MYTEMVCVSRLKLSSIVEPFVVGLLDVLIDFPFDVMGIKLLWWTWHESDPNIYDRTYFIPWTRYAICIICPVCMCVCVCMYVRMYVCMCMYVRTYVCMYV